MLSIQDARKLLPDGDALPDDEVRQIRDACYELAHIIVDFRKWQRGWRRDNLEESGKVN
jgi:hypothetical protein